MYRRLPRYGSFMLAAGLAVSAVAQVPPAHSRPATRPNMHAAPVATAPVGPPPRVVLEIAQGEEDWGRIVLELNPEKTPITVENFLRYVDSGYYDGTIFHRVLPNFMIQGGGYMALNELKKTGLTRPIANEARKGLKNVRGTIAMARTRNPSSATSQFFINVIDNPQLDFPSRDGWGYCAFGTVVEGMDVVDRIRRVPTQRDPAGPDQAPSQPVDPPRIKRASREGGAPATQTADSQPAPVLPSETMPEPPPADEPRPTEPPGPTPVPESPPAEPAQPN